LDWASTQRYKQASFEFMGRSKTKMSATSGDNIGGDGKHAGNSAPAIRSLAVSGNRIDSRELFSSEREIIIAHGAENYRLRLTSQNKLILTK
jgi:hemin uptake protein HemP